LREPHENHAKVSWIAVGVSVWLEALRVRPRDPVLANFRTVTVLEPTVRQTAAINPLFVDWSWSRSCIKLQFIPLNEVCH
jgi:hypothetical protein